MTYDKFPQLVKFSIFLLLISCSNKGKSSHSSLEELTHQYDLEIREIGNKNDSLANVITLALQKETTFRQAEYWYPRIMALRYQSDKVKGYLHIKETALEENFGKLAADSLYYQLIAYKEYILRIDPSLTPVIQQDAKIITHNLDSASVANRGNLTAYLHGATNPELICYLKQIEYHLKKLEFNALTYCVNKL